MHAGQDTCPCLQTNGSGLPFFQGYAGEAGGPDRRIHHQHQAIIPSYKFNCCGSITEWGVDLNPDRDEASKTFDFILQVWRPSPTGMNQLHKCYSLVNDHKVTSTVVNSTGRVAKVTSLPQNQLQFQPGDVLGFYVESHGSDSDYDNGVVLLNNGSHTSELVWHGSITSGSHTSQSGSCPYPVGANGVLSTSTHAAPVISISVMVTTCHIYSSLLDSITTTTLPNFARTTKLIFKLSPSIGSTHALIPGSNDGITITNGLITGLMVSIFVVVSIMSTTIIIAVAIIIKRHRSTKQAESAGMTLSNQLYGESASLHLYNYCMYSYLD